MMYGNVDNQYTKLIKTILSKLDRGVTEDRTGAGRVRIFNYQMGFNLQEEFPLIECKKAYFSAIVKELGWFGRGSVNIKDLDCTIWDEWSHKGDATPFAIEGDIGPMYGTQWRHSPGVDPHGNYFEVDQLSNLIDELKTNPFSSRLIVDSWNPHFLPRPNLSVEENIEQGYMALAPCHFAFQCFVEEIKGVKHLSLKYHQRSADSVLGIAYNVASYSLLCMLLANECGYQFDKVISDMGDVHIYGNHLDGIDQLLKQAEDLHIRKTRERAHGQYKVTKLVLPAHVTIRNLHQHVDEVVAGLQNYNPLPAIKFARN